MSVRKYSFVPGEFYHIYNRGNDKRVIYKDPPDYERFMELLFLSNSRERITVKDIKNLHTSVYDFEVENRLVSIGAYCLMPNHFHILLTPLVENGVQLFLQKLSTGYVMFFNHRYERTGSLFEGKFKSAYADSDEYLKYLFSYIHLNPIKRIQADWKEVGIKNIAVAKEYLSSYPFSSYTDFSRGLASGERQEKKILDLSAFPEYFLSVQAFETEIFEWLSFPLISPEARPREK